MPKRNQIISGEIGRRMQQKRKQMHLTQEAAAERAGLSKQFWACAERGVKGLGFDSIIRVSAALETTTDYLLTGRIPPEERSYAQVLLALMTEEQRGHAVKMLQEMLCIYGYKVPEPEINSKDYSMNC